MPINFHVLWFYTTTESAKKVIEQSSCLVNLLMEIKLYEHSQANNTAVKEKRKEGVFPNSINCNF